MEKEDYLLDLISYRKQKQLQAEKNADTLFSQASDFSVRYSNIREKVRAKHLFRQQIYFSNDLPLPKYLEDIFHQWLLFDYHTVQGETMFSLFLKQYSAKLSEPELILGALFLATYVEPFEILEIDDVAGSLQVREILEGKNYIVIYNTKNDLNIQKGDYVFFRKLPLLTKDWVIGPVYSIKTKSIINQLMDTYEQAKIASPSLTWRTYLKRNGYFLLTHLRPEK